MQSILQAISTWPLVALVLGLAAMLIFREAISAFISRSHEWRAGRFSAKAKPSGGPDPRIIAQTVREILENMAGQEPAAARLCQCSASPDSHRNR
jgi:Zn-dependent protease with chaperone function